MIPDYDNIIKLLPKNTIDFLKEVLPYIDYYNINIENDDGNIYAKYFLVLLKIISKENDILAYFSKYAFDSNKIVLQGKNSSDNLETLYQRNTIIIPSYQDLESYRNLSPIDILLFNFNNSYNYSNTTIFANLFDNLFNGLLSISDFKETLSNINRINHEIEDKKIEEDCFGNLNVSVINYLTTASKIRHLFLTKEILPEEFSKNDIDLIPLSLFFSAFIYDDPVKDEEKITEKELILKYFKENGISSINTLLTRTDEVINKTNLKKCDRYLKTIKEKYSKYYIMGNCVGIQEDTITVSDILNNVFDRSFTKSYIIDELLSRSNKHIKEFTNISENINKIYQIEKRKKKEEVLDTFYKGLSKNVKEYIEFSCKIYQILEDKLNSNLLNSSLVQTLDDTLTLSLFISSFYYDTDIAKFYKIYGITLSKVFEEIGFILSKEEINNTKLDEKILTDKFNKFIRDGNCRGVSVEYITPNKISYNLCNNTFTKTTILEEIFNSLTDEIKISGNFEDKIKKELVLIEKKNQKEIFEKVFNGIPLETVKFFEKLSIVHFNISRYLNHYNLDDIKAISLILTLVEENNIYGEFIRSLGITKEKIESYFEVDKNSNKYGVDINIIKDYYLRYLFGGRNKNIKKEDLTLDKVVINIFNSDLNNSMEFIKFLDELGLNFDDFENIEELIENYKVKKIQHQQQESLKKSAFKYGILYELEYAFKVYKYIEENNIENDFLKESDKVCFSILLSLLINAQGNDKYYKFLSKYNLTSEKIIDLIINDNNFLEKIKNSEIDYRILEKLIKYTNQFNKLNSYPVKRDDIAKMLFDKNINDSMLIEKICNAYNVDYSILKREILSGVDYEESLTIKERIILLENCSEDIDCSNIESILQFGNSLSTHSKYIYKVLPELVESDSCEKSIESIKSITEKIYKTQDERKNIFIRLFKIERKENNNVIIDKNVIEELKKEIDRNIVILSKELLIYDEIRRYMEMYKIKNATLYQTIKEEDNQITLELQELNPEKEEQFTKFLRLRSLHQILSDKKNRFLTTNTIIEQDLLRINDAITNHFITINALEMAKNDLFPLIGAELALSIGKESEKEALKLSSNIVKLFESLLTRNIDNTLNNMELIKNSTLSNEIVEKITTDIEKYLSNLESFKLTDKNAKRLDISETYEKGKIKKLKNN